jgi:hypothetical protein
MLKKRIATVAVAGIAALGVGHMVLAATEITGSNQVEDSDTTTGDANSQNNAAVLNGQFGGPNAQNGDNEAELGQNADARSGDGVNGQVIGAVDGSGSGAGAGFGSGGASVNASNSCEDCDSETGDANTQNNAAVANGQFGGPNAQEGDNETEVEQDADSQSGDANNGQVIGVVSE